MANQEEEEVEEGGGGDGVTGDEDLHSLLVKAWETKVFPLIQRRFRNDQERKSGLDQIKGALQLGTLLVRDNFNVIFTSKWVKISPKIL